MKTRTNEQLANLLSAISARNFDFDMLDFDKIATELALLEEADEYAANFGSIEEKGDE